MNFSTAGLNILSSNTTQLNATYLQNAIKLSQYISLTKPLFGSSPKKVLISSDRQILTQITKIIIDVLPITSSNSLVLKEVLKKVESLGDGSTTVVLFSAMLSLNLVKLVDDGYSRTSIAKTLRKIRSSLEVVKVDIFQATIDDASYIVSGVLKDRFLIDLVSSACVKVFAQNSHEETSNDFSDSNDKSYDSNENSESILNFVEKNQSMPKMIQNTSIKDTLSLKYDSNETIAKLVCEIEDRIRIIKIPIGTTSQSLCLNGLLFKGLPLTLKKTGKNFNTSIYSSPVEISRTNEKGTLLFTSAEQLLNFSESEQTNISKITDDLTVNSDLVICSGNIEEGFLHYFDNKNTLVFDLPSKHDIRRVRNLFNGIISPVLKPLLKEHCGTCDQVSSLEFGCVEYTWFKNKNANVCSIILQNAIPIVIDENERLILKAFKTLITQYPKYIIMKGCGYFERCVSDQITQICDTKDMYERGVIDVFKNTIIELVSELDNTEGMFDVLNVRVKAFQYAIDVCCVVLETQDMFAVRDALDIGKRPDLPRDI